MYTAAGQPAKDQLVQRFVPLVKPEYCFANRQSLPDVVRPNGALYIFDAGLEDAAINEKLARHHGLLGTQQEIKLDHWGRRQLAYKIGTQAQQLDASLRRSREHTAALAGLSGFCGLALLLQKMPWNRSPLGCQGPSCSR